MYYNSLLEIIENVLVLLLLSICWMATQVLREFNHVNPQDDEEGKTFSNTRVSILLCVLGVLLNI